MTRIVTSAFVAALGVAFLASPAAQAQDVGIASSNPGSLYHSSASAVAKLANDKAGLGMTVHPFASATVYLPAVNAGEYAFGITNVSELRKAVTGSGHFKGRVHTKIRAVSIAYPLRVAWFVRKDSPIKSIADLKGKRITDGFNSQKTIPAMLDAQLATAGLTRKDTRPVIIPNVVAGANAFISGKADAFFFALGAAKVREANASVGGIRALDIANTAENLSKIHSIFYEHAYLRPEKPHKRNIGVHAALHVMTYDAAIVANADLSEDVVYRLAKAMHDNKKHMASTFGVFNLFNPKRMATKLDPIQWHPGTIKFLKEKGMWPPKS